MEVTIKGKVSSDPRDRILALEAVTQSICRRTGHDPAEGVMMLLTAAVHLSMKHSGKPVNTTAMALAEALGAAIVSADQMFKLREVNPNAR